MRAAGTHLLVAFLVTALARGAHAAPPLLVPVPVIAHKGYLKLLVVVAPLDARAKAQAGLLEQVIEGVADADDKFDLQRGFDAYDPSAARARADKETEAKKKSAEAKQALDDLDSAKATSLYAESLAAWKQADLTHGIDGLVEAWSGKAAGHAVSEENPQAKAEIEKVLTLSTKTKFSDAQFPPELLKYAESQRKAVNNAKGKMTVRTDPAGARVWVDGVYRGASPVTVEGVSGGKHLIVTGLAGYSLGVTDGSPGEELVKLKTAELGPQLQDAVDRIAKDPDGPGRDLAARSVGTAVMADQVLLIVVKKSVSGEKLDATGVRLDVKDGHNYAWRTGQLSTAPSDLRSIDEWVSSLLSKDDPRVDRQPVTHFAGDAGGGGSKVSGRRALGIGLMGGALVCGASWGVFAFSAMGQASLYKSTFQVEALKSSQAASSGRLFSIVADISWGVGLALLVVGVLLAVTGSSSSSSSGSSSSSSSSGSGSKKPKEDDAMKAYREHQEEERRKDEERQRQAEEDKKKAAEPAPEATPAPAEEKKKEPEAAPAEEKKKKLTPEEEKAEKKKKAEEEKAEKKRKAEEEKAEKKRKAEEAKAEKKRKAEEEKAEKKKKADEAKAKAEEDKKKTDEEKKAAAAKAEEDKKKTDEEKKAAAAKAEEDKKKSDEEKKAKAEEDKKRADEDKAKAEEDKKRAAEEQQKKKDEEEARKADEERRKKEEEQRKKSDEQKPPDKKPDKKDEDDLRNF